MIDPAAALHRIADQLEAEAAELRELAAAIETGEAQPENPRTICAKEAAAILGCSLATIYRRSEEFGLGFKTPTGRLVIDEAEARRFARHLRNSRKADAKDENFSAFPTLPE